MTFLFPQASLLIYQLFKDTVSQVGDCACQ